MTQNTLWQPSDINPETGAEGGEPESPKRRGRIPQSAWPQILERYRAGATLSAIAREFECTPSAISYIVRKAEAGGTAAADTPDEAPDTSDAPAEAAPAAEAPPAAPAPVPAPAPRAPRRVAEAARPPAPPAPPTAEAPPPAKPVETARPADAPKMRLELKREDPRPAPVPAAPPAPAAAPAASAPAAQAPAPGDAPPAAAPRPAGARPEPTPPVDETEARLRETARGCLAAYRTWRQQPGQGSIQTLSDAVHDLRKVLARIEIDMSVSRRDEQVARPIPIPAHRAARRPQ